MYTNQSDHGKAVSEPCNNSALGAAMDNLLNNNALIVNITDMVRSHADKFLGGLPQAEDKSPDKSASGLAHNINYSARTQSDLLRALQAQAQVDRLGNF